MKKTVAACLQDLDNRIVPDVEDRLWQAWGDFIQDRFQGELFSPQRSARSLPEVEWPQVSINTALDDFDMMVLQQFGECSQKLVQGSGAVLNVRCNYGSSIVPLLFGVEPFVMDEDLDTLPTSRPLNDVDAIKRIVDAGVPDISQGYGGRVIEMAERYMAIARQYPKIGRYVPIYHPDCQGPMDICEVVWGSSLFYAFYDHPELVKGLLEVVTDTYIAFMRAWVEIVPFRKGGNAHWGFLHMGNIMLRDDSAMNLSPAMFDEFVKPYDQRLLNEFGGGAIHFCGKGDHYIASMSEMEGLFGIHMSQPEYNDMDIIFDHTVDKGVKLVGLDRATAQDAIANGRDLRGQVQAF